jgi:methionyl-tRNA synthetase
MASPFYITCAIDYVNGKPHLGHAYEKITADVIARWRRLQGDDVRFLVGTDEHGSKIEKTAEKEGVTPQEYVDRLVPSFVEAYDLLNISYDRFIRTTDADHKRTVVSLLEAINAAGHLRVDTYTGWYCDGCEAFKTEKDLVDAKCPEHPTREPKWIEEENLFFALSKFQQPLLNHIAANPSFIEPATRRNEVLAMLKDDLRDISISRSKSAVTWGIDIPFHDDAVIYVWYDALINYLTGVGYGTDDALFEKYWPAAHHIIGKDITRFHCVLWPAMLLAAGVPLPQQIFAHGFVLQGGERMSKSSGVGVDPADVATRYGADPLRYFLVAEITHGRDGEFSWERFEEIYTAHLANGLGNLLSRSIGMTVKYFGGVPAEGGTDPMLKTLTDEAVAAAVDAHAALRLQDGVAAAWKIVRTCNEQVQAREPWKMAKDDAQREDLATFLYGLLESVRLAAVLLSPVMPGKTADILAALGVPLEGDAPTWADTAWGGLPRGLALERPAPLFPRLDQLLSE